MLSLLLMAALAAQDPTPAATLSEPPAILAPQWVATPSPEDAQAVYPKAAAEKRLEGRATLKCGVNGEGFLKDCASIAEEPAGLGFGAAALAIAPKFQMAKVTKDGVPVAGGVVRVPIRFANPTQMQPGFRRMPSTDDMAKVYPKKALGRNVAGQAVIDCGVAIDGNLYDCALSSETPVNYEFGQAALQLAPLFNLEPRTKDGKPVRYAVSIPIKFGSVN
ncbi:MAG: TonB family protein [Phenylobacterium sp.]